MKKNNVAKPSKSTGISIDDLNEPDVVEVVVEAEAPKVAPRVKKKKPLWLIIVIGVLIAGFIGFSIYGYTVRQAKLQVLYDAALADYELGDYDTALNKFYDIKGFKDAATMAAKCDESMNEEAYVYAMGLKESGNYTEAIDEFEIISSYKDSEAQAKNCETIRRKLYIEYIGLEAYKLNKYKELSVAMTDVIARDWGVAAEAGRDSTVALQDTYKHWEANIKTLKIGAEGLKKQIEDIEELEGAETAYQQIQELYSIYTKIHEQVVSPTGGLLEYTKKLKDFSDNFDALLDKLFVNETEAKGVFNSEVQKALEEELNKQQKVIPEVPSNETTQPAQPK